MTQVMHRGGCHCGAVRFSVRAPAYIDVDDCNCSICSMVGFLHLIVARENFSLEQGKDALTEYNFGTGAARHLFCKHCGIKSFYVPRSHPNGYSVNARCLDMDMVERINVRPFDGLNWEKNVESLRSRT